MSRLVPLAATLLLLSCGGGPKKLGSQPSWRGGADGAADKPAGPQSVVFAPSGTAVDRYNQKPIPVAPADPLAERIVAAIRDASVEAGMTPPEPDGRLYKAAADLAAVVPEDAPMKYPAVEFAMQRHGIIEPSPHLMVIWGPIDDADAIIEQLHSRIPEILQSGPFSRIGFGRASRGKSGEGAAILALQTSNIDTEPIPRALPGGGSFPLRGRIRQPFQEPEVFVTRDNGVVDELSVVRGPGGAFAAEFDCGSSAGRQQVEVTAVDATGSTVLANFPVWCGQRPPASITLHYNPDDGLVSSAEAAERRLIELINADRERYNLPPLAHDPRVSEVARAHSREMYETGVVAHISPRTGSASDRVRRAGIKTPVVLENVARAYGVGEAEEGLMNSPGHRANILSRDATHVGVGIVVGEEVAGRRELFITQVFTYRAGKADMGDVGRALRGRIAGVSQIIHDGQLAKLAQTQANEIAGGVSNQEATRRTSERARGLTARFSRVTTAVVAIPRVEALDPHAVVDDKTFTHYGLGVAQAPHDQMGDNALYVVLLLATAR